MKIVVNRCFGGFSLSKEAYEYLGWEWDGSGHHYISRTNPKLIECVETLGTAKASGSCARLVVAEIEDGIDWQIDEYDGNETIVEPYEVLWPKEGESWR